MALFVMYYVFIDVYVFLYMYYVFEWLISLDKQGNSAKRKCILLLSSFCVVGDGSAMCQERKPKRVLQNSFKEINDLN